MSENTAALIISAALESIKIGVSLMEAAERNPGMTPEEADELVNRSKANAQAAVDDWRSARAGNEGQDADSG